MTARSQPNADQPDMRRRHSIQQEMVKSRRAAGVCAGATSGSITFVIGVGVTLGGHVRATHGLTDGAGLFVCRFCEDRVRPACSGAVLALKGHGRTGARGGPGRFKR